MNKGAITYALPNWKKPFSLMALSFFFTFFILLGVDSVQAASLDFGWGTPIEITEKIERKGEKQYLVWPIQISNRSGKRWLPRLDIVAVTDTGKQYAPTPTLKVSASGEAASLASLENHLFPSVTRHAMVVFERIDPKAKVIHLYVGGLVDIPDREMKYLRITYKRSLSGWEWEDSSALE